MVVERFVESALAYCVEKHGRLKNRREAIQRLLEEDREVHSVFRYALGRSVCDYLAQQNETVDACYLTGSLCNDRAGVTSDVDMILESRYFPVALAATLQRVNRDLLVYYRGLVGARARHMRSMLDPQFVTLARNRNHRRRFSRPLLMWRRELPECGGRIRWTGSMKV